MRLQKHRIQAEGSHGEDEVGRLILIGSLHSYISRHLDVVLQNEDDRGVGDGRGVDLRQVGQLVDNLKD